MVKTNNNVITKGGKPKKMPEKRKIFCLERFMKRESTQAKMNKGRCEEIERTDSMKDFKLKKSKDSKKASGGRGQYQDSRKKKELKRKLTRTPTTQEQEIRAKKHERRKVSGDRSIVMEEHESDVNDSISHKSSDMENSEMSKPKILREETLPAGTIKWATKRQDNSNSTEVQFSISDLSADITSSFGEMKISQISESSYDPDSSDNDNDDELIDHQHMVPPVCMQERLWQVERTLGAILIDTRYLSSPQLLSRSQCYQKCIEAGPQCKSAQFRTSNPLAVGDAQGLCTLLTIERSNRPQSYRASLYRDEYLGTQCHNLSSLDYCSHAEFYNQTLPYADLKISGLNEKQCEERCNNGKDGFICRAFTIDHTARRTESSSACLLHSDDTISAGVSALTRKDNVIYKEREPCLNLKVACGNDSLVIELETQEPFTGRLYASGYSETCDVQGNGTNRTLLILKIPDEKEMDKGNVNCGIMPAYALEENNQTRLAVWVTIVVQFNPIIQRLGDQALRVGCTPDDGEVPLPRNVSVETGYGFTSADAGLPPLTGTIFNTTSPPIVMMRIVDTNMNEITSAVLGQRLVLKIEIYPSDGPYDITARHLVASSTSGDSSILLLDEIGCPADAKIFPAMVKDPHDNKSLISTFTAFKFPDSYRVRFIAVVKFCFTMCEPTTCRDSVMSYGRRRRSLGDIIPIENSENSTLEEFSLESSIIIRDATIAADPLRSGNKPDTVLIAGEQPMDRLLCVDAALALGLLILWLIVQIVLTITCIYVIRRYRRLARKAEEDRADILARHLYGIHGGNFEISRRVRWADHNGTTIS